MLSGFAATIQFHPGVTGEIPGGGRAAATFCPQHNAIPAAPVRVGVTKIRSILVFVGMSHHPAPIGQGGHIRTMAQFVFRAKIGSPLLTATVAGVKDISGYPIMTGDDPGASGA